MSGKQHSIKLNNGRLMPIIGLGTALADHSVFRKAILCALDYGYRSIDTAFLYTNEHIIGEAVEEWLKSGNVKREELFITSKLPAMGNRPEHVNKFLTKSLKALKLDYLDLYLVHHPFGMKYLGDDNPFSKDEAGNSVMDHDTDIEAVWKAMEAEVEAGRVRAIGISNYNGSQVDRIMKVAKIPPSVHQIELHAYLQQRPLVEKCKKYGIVVEAFSPIGAPFSSEAKSMKPPLLENPTLKEIGENHRKSITQVLLRFLIQQDIRVIPKSVTPERIKANFDVFDFNLSEEEMKKILDLDRGEAARVYNYLEVFKTCTTHKEYPFK